MSNQIVVLNVSVVKAPTPSNLQKSGAIISQGATIYAKYNSATPARTLPYITQLSDLTSNLTGGIAITSMTYSSGVVTVALAGPHGIPVGEVIQGTIAGVTPSGYNTTAPVTYVSANSFTYALGNNPGTVTVQGTFTLQDVQELVAQATTFFANGTNVGFYVLELGTGNPADGVTALTSYIANPIIPMYAYLCPGAWYFEPTAAALFNQYAANTSKVYFLTNYTVNDTNGSTTPNAPTVKSQFALQQDPYFGTPTIPRVTATTEFDTAAVFYALLSLAPSPTNLAAPFCYRYMFGVVPFTAANYSGTVNQAEIALANANINFIETGAEGGISNTMLYPGVLGDGSDISFWYATDWVQINADLNLSNEIINGSNNALNPLYYNQSGINRLQKRLQSVMNQAVSYGLVLGGSVTVNAIPFAQYVIDNPNDYPAGLYAGLSVTFTPQRGFRQITLAIVVNQFATG